MIPLTWIVAGTMSAAAFAGGYRVANWRAASDALTAARAQAEATALARRTSYAAGLAFERERVVIRREFVPLYERVEHVVTEVEYRDRACLDDRGVRIVNDAVRAANRAAPAEPGGTVRTDPGVAGRPVGNGAPPLREVD